MKSAASGRHARHEVRLVEAGARIRGLLAGETLVDSKRAVLLHETGRPPVYYFPRKDVNFRLLEPTPRRTHCPVKGDACYWTLRTGPRRAEDAAWSYEAPFDEVAGIRGHIAFAWHGPDVWLADGERIDSPR